MHVLSVRYHCMHSFLHQFLFPATQYKAVLQKQLYYDLLHIKHPLLLNTDYVTSHLHTRHILNNPSQFSLAAVHESLCLDIPIAFQVFHSLLHLFYFPGNIYHFPIPHPSDSASKVYKDEQYPVQDVLKKIFLHCHLPSNA